MTKTEFDKPMVYVRWYDSVTSSSWSMLDEVNENILTCETIGYLVNENDKGVTIAQTIGDNPPQICNSISIPKCAIISFAEFEPKYLDRK